MEYLFLMLGTGPAQETRQDVLERNYRRATYFLPEWEERGLCETPFIGQALLHLYPERFREIHLFGTPDSMWHTLYRHLLGDPLDPAQTSFFLGLAGDIDERRLTVESEVWGKLEAAYGRTLGIPVTCNLLPLPTSDENIWTILQAMTSTGVRRGRLSIDITHGLRSHPVFSLLALFYLRTVYPDIEIGSIFYGAYELRGQYNDKTPIFDLKPAIELVDWMEATRAFDRYSDAGLISKLLREKDSGMYAELAKRAEYFSRVLQLNTLGDLPANGRRFVGAIHRIENDLPAPIALLRERLADFPGRVAGLKQSWEVYLQAARYHWDHYRAGLAVLAAWEAVITRLAAAYGISDVSQRSVYKRLGQLARFGKGIKNKEFKHMCRTLNDHMRRLYTYRNGIAHVDEETTFAEFQPNEVYQRFPVILEYLECELPKSWLDQVTTHAPWKPAGTPG